MDPKKMARKLAKNVVKEPLEILETAKNQVTGSETTEKSESIPVSRPAGQSIEETKQREETDRARSKRRMEALNREISDIQRQDLFSDLQNKISWGIEVPIEDYSELSMEQKQVLKAQTEAVKMQKQQVEAASVNKVPSVHSKLGRRFGAGQKAEAERQQTRVEKPMPPSG